MEGENTYTVCEWHHTGRSWNYFGKQDETHKWFQNLEIWHETKKVESETNQEKSHFGRRNPTQSWNMWLSSKPNNHLEFQLDKTLKRTQHYGSEVLERVISEVFTKISYTGCNYPPVVSAGRPQLESCIWAEAALSKSHRKILECHQSCDKFGIKRARASKSSQGFYGSSQVMVEVGKAVTVQCWGTETHPHEAPQQKTLLSLPTSQRQTRKSCVQEEVKRVWSKNLQ